MANLTPPPDPEAPTPFLGLSKAIRELWEQILKAAPLKFHVRIEGETGTGKSAVAAALHQNNPRRRDGPFHHLPCTAIPPGLLHGLLLGYVRGAFTGAVHDTPGCFEQAHKGTLFLDEIGEADALAQAALLTIVESRKVTRIGETRARRIDVRLVFATNRHLRTEVREGRFRDDLLHRIAALPIKVPPLRDRIEDLPFILDRILRQVSERIGRTVTLSDDHYDLFTRYPWPGNIRQLEHAVIQYGGLGTLPEEIRDWRKTHLRTEVPKAVKHHRGNKSRAAVELDISRQTVYDTLRKAEPL